MNGGWIKLHRSILDHWIWKDKTKFGWWMEMLFMANWEDGKVLVGNTLVDVKRGQMLASNGFLSRRWRVHPDTVRSFLRLLESDNMITQETHSKFNLLTICNYEKYQDVTNPNTEVNTEVNANPNTEVNANPNAEKEKEKEKKIPPTPPIKENKNKKEKIEKEVKKDIPLTYVSGASKKKYSAAEQKLHGELRDIFCEEWKKTHGDDFYWGADAMTNTIKITEQIKFYMPPEQKDDNEQLKFNFRIFIQKILTSSDSWLRTNATPRVIASKFNEIYTSLKNENNASTSTNRINDRPSMVERTLRKYAAMYGNGQPDGGVGTQR